MDFKLGVLLVISAHICTTLALPPCVCTRNLRPVCGSDDVTYGNNCILECAAFKSGKTITVAKYGPCNTDTATDDCKCITEEKPVCGTDGQTYRNACYLNCNKAKFNEALHVDHSGPCVTPRGSECICTAEEDPVCGSDGRTYGNDCMLNCATMYNPRLSVSHRGECTKN